MSSQFFFEKAKYSPYSSKSTINDININYNKKTSDIYYYKLHLTIKNLKVKKYFNALCYKNNRNGYFFTIERIIVQNIFLITI